MNISRAFHPASRRRVSAYKRGHRFIEFGWLQISAASPRCRQSISQRLKSRLFIRGLARTLMTASVTTPLEKQFGQIPGLAS